MLTTTTFTGLRALGFDESPLVLFLSDNNKD
jgi:hypothetical protein